jgi:hypothetical protein
MVINLEARHILEAHKEELQVLDGFVRVLDEDDSIIHILEVCDASWNQVRDQPLNVIGPCHRHQNTGEGFANKIEEKRRERVSLTHSSLIPEKKDQSRH